MSVDSPAFPSKADNCGDSSPRKVGAQNDWLREILPTADRTLPTAYRLTGTLVAVVSWEIRKVTSVPWGITMFLPFLEKSRAMAVMPPVP